MDVVTQQELALNQLSDPSTLTAKQLKLQL